MKVKEVASVTLGHSIELLIWDGDDDCCIRYWNDITMKRYGDCEVKRIVPICVAQTFTTDDEVVVVTKLRIEIENN